MCGGVSAVERHLTDIGGRHVEIKDWRGAVRAATIVTDAVSRPKKAKKSKSLGSSLADPARRANLPLTVGGVEIVPDTVEQITGAVNHQGEPVAQTPVAQRSEPPAHNGLVAGSNPAGRTAGKRDRREYQRELMRERRAAKKAGLTLEQWRAKKLKGDVS